MEKEIATKLQKIQQVLDAPKDLRNNFGNYNYRSAESILKALKEPLLINKCSLIISDEVEDHQNMRYIKATATLIDCETGQSISVTALAREEDSKKGMDASQITGATSSYARKYALNGLFAIDDNRDFDTDEAYRIVNGISNNDNVSPSTKTSNANANASDVSEFIKQLKAVKSIAEMSGLWQTFPVQIQTNEEVKAAGAEIKSKLPKK